MPAYFEKLCICLVFATLCGCQSETNTFTRLSNKPCQSVRYSTIVKDSFYIQTQLPLAYNDSASTRYPVAVVLDGNFHFPMLAASVRQYEQAGLLPPLILIGIGYRSFGEMDSLRVRDCLYPSALPSDEMSAPGGGEKFRQFISRELLPSIDSVYRTTTNDRALLGHSFGGYFALYTLLTQAKNKAHDFQKFVAASPPVWYNNYYLNELPSQLATLNKADSTQLFLSVGELENPQWDVKPNRNLANKLRQVSTLKVVGSSYGQLGHMDTGQLSFLKGLQEFYR